PAIATRITHIHFYGFLEPYEERKVTQSQVVAELRRRLVVHPTYKPAVTVRTAVGGGDSGSYVLKINLMGNDIQQLADIALKWLEKAEKSASIADSKVGVTLSNPEIRVAVDRRRAADLGVRMATVGKTLRLAVSGEDEISNYREGSEQYPVTMR